MKKTMALLAAILCALSLTLTGCNDNKTSSDSSQSSVDSIADSSSDGSDSSDESSDDLSDSDESHDDAEDSESVSVWDSAKYTEDTEIGEGAVTVKVEVTADNRTVTLTVKTDETNFEKILTANDLVEGDESEFGLYIKSVNGIRADYDLDHAYWSIEKDGAPTLTGAGGITVEDGDTYALVYTAA